VTDEGWLAEFADPVAFHRAVTALCDEGFMSVEVFTPYPLPSLLERLIPRPSAITKIAGAAAIVGVTVGYVLQWYLNAYRYPLDAGGRPLHSVPAFVPITFETGVLFAALAVFAAALLLSGMPRLWRPIFEVEGFERASIDRFFVLVRSDDPRFDWIDTRDRLLQLRPLRVVETVRRPR
jgi:hypothetical protein